MADVFGKAPVASRLAVETESSPAAKDVIQKAAVALTEATEDTTGMESVKFS